MKQFEKSLPENTIREEMKNQMEKKIIRADGVINESFRSIQEKNREYFKTADIVFQNENGVKFSFSDLLPAGWTFLSRGEWQKINPSYGGAGSFFCDPKNKTVIYEDLSKEGALLALLHEIGHAHLDERGKGFSLIENGGDLLEYIFDHENRDLTENKIKERGESIDDYEVITVYDPMGKGTGGQDNDEVWVSMFIPKALIVQFGREWAASERGAWAYALRTLRRVRKKGLTVEFGFKTLQDLQNEIYSSLATYEKRYEKEYKDKSSPFLKRKKFIEKEVGDKKNQ